MDESETFAHRQVTPFAHWHLCQWDLADADATDRQHLEADLRAHVAQLPALYALDREPQAEFVLPADLARWQRATVERETMVESAQAVGRDLPGGVDDVFLLDLVAILGQAAPHPAILAQHHQSAGIVVQRHQWRQPEEVALEHADAGRILRP